MRHLASIAILSAALVYSGTLEADELEAPPARAVAFSPDGRLLAAGFGSKDVAGGLVLWDIEKKQVARVLPRDRGISTVAFSPSGQWLAFSVYDQPPQVVEVASGELVATLADDRRGPVAFSPDGQLLATGCLDKGIPLWDLATKMDRQVLTGAKDRTYGVAFSTDGSLLVTPCGSEGVYVWDITMGRPRHILRHGSFFNRSALVSHDGRWIITGGWDGTVRIWNAESGEERARITGVFGVDALGFAPSIDALAVGANGRDIRLFEIAFSEPTLGELARIRELLSHFEDDGYTIREAASADLIKLGFRAEAELRRVAAESPSAETRIRARRARQAILAQPAATLSGHQAGVQGVAFSPDGKLLASASEDGTVRLWDVRQRREVDSFTPAAAK